MITGQYTGTRQPDILEVIANLSNNEVFTPPRVANDVLNLLPDDVWKNPNHRWLDPGSKTGVFPREITRRLMIGLSEAIPDESERLRHILTDMVYAVAITEMTGMMSRRSLYCSKDASSAHSATGLRTSAGNVWHGRVEHSFDHKGRCSECGGTQSQLDTAGSENYAYAFIHSDGKERLAEAMDMRFDVIVGNPPYQMDAADGNRTMPIYNLFVEQAKKLNPKYLLFITPSRWMAGGLGLNEYRAAMLADTRIRKLVDFPDPSDVFPGVEIKGGVCYFLWDRDNPGACSVTHIRNKDVVGPTTRNLGEFDVFVRDERGLRILKKVRAKPAATMADIIAADKEFGFTSNFDDFASMKFAKSIPIYAIQGGRRTMGWISRSKVVKSSHLIDLHKVLLPQAYGAGDNLPHQILGQPMTVSAPSCCTQSYLFIYLQTEEEARSAESYVRTRFVRFLVSLRKISQHATRSTYTWVPQQTWDRMWTDVELYKKYGITREEQSYIESMVKEMPA